MMEQGNFWYRVFEDEEKTYIEVIDYYDQPVYRASSYNKNNLAATTAELHIAALCGHITYVREAGKKLNVSKEQLMVHDASKWSREEFVGYAQNFHGNKAGVRVVDEFANAWLNHIHHNPHHWQHWIFPDGFTPKESAVENGTVYMPPAYALEMVADWMGASMSYTGSWDMADWLQKNMSKIKLHSRTAAYVRGILDNLGYADIVYMTSFGHE
jgi:hypothetical protein